MISSDIFQLIFFIYFDVCQAFTRGRETIRYVMFIMEDSRNNVITNNY
jgi:hypothetical protein